MKTPVRRPCRRSPRRRGVVLLFVVVLLTLLAIVGSAFLISTRLGAGQIGVEARGQQTFADGVSAEGRLNAVRDAAVRAAKLTVALDVFETERTAPGGAATTAERNIDFSTLRWRPTRTTANEVFTSTTVAPGMGGRSGDTTPVFAYGERVFGVTEFLGGTDPTAGTLAAGTAPPLRFPYYHLDAVGDTDPHLASPRPDAAGTWPRISAPMGGIPELPIDYGFVDVRSGAFLPTNRLITPADPATVADPARALLEFATPTTTGPVTHDGNPAANYVNDRNRVYPALAYTVEGTTVTLPAADADGDGVADAGLVPIVFRDGLPTTDPDRYIDATTGLAYTISLRVVDNNASLNVNTALALGRDQALTDNPSTYGYDSAAATPNRGFWPSNVGMFELFPLRAAGISGNFGDTAQTEFRRLVPELLGSEAQEVAQAFAKLQRGRTAVQAAAPAVDADVRAATLGEVLTFGLATRLDNPAATAAVPEATPNPARILQPRPFTDDATVSSLLHRGGGFIDQRRGQNRLERTAPAALWVGAGNYVTNPDLAWGFFPLYAPTGDDDIEGFRRLLWAEMFATADPGIPDYAFDLSSDTRGTNTGTGVGGTSTAIFPISPRSGLVADNGVSMAFPPLLLDPTGDFDDVDQVPFGMPAYGGVDGLPPVAAGLNAASFGELWRAYWNVMARPDAGVTPVVGPETFPAGAGEEFDADAPRTGLPALSAQQMVLLRSALAAVNTMDIRDFERRSLPPAVPLSPNGDSDITVAEIDLGTFGPDGAPGTAHIARVFGTEAQPFITEVLIEFNTDGDAVEYAGVELYNPFPYEIDLTGYRLVAVNADFSTVNVLHDFAAGEVIPADEKFVVHTDPPAPAVPPTPPSPPSTPGTPGRARFVEATGVQSPGTIQIFFDTAPAGARMYYLQRPANEVAPVGDFADYVPLDMFDLRGIETPAALPATPYANYRQLHYARDDAPGDWKFVHHGPYDAAAAPPAAVVPSGTGASAGVPTVGFFMYEPGDANANLGDASDPVNFPPTFTVTHGFPLGPALSGPLGNTPAAGEPAFPTFPYGGFARGGDAAVIPIVGGYVLYSVPAPTTPPDPPASPTPVAVRPVTVDLDHALVDDAAEPLRGRMIHALADGTPVYAWSENLLDYVTAYDNYGTDTFPNADLRYNNTDDSLNTLDNLEFDDFLTTYVAAAGALFSEVTAGEGDVLLPADNTGSGVAGSGLDADTQAERYREAFVPARGRVNLLTATPGILATLPLSVSATGTSTPDGGAAGNVIDFATLGLTGGLGDPPVLGVMSFGPTLHPGGPTPSAVARGRVQGLNLGLYNATGLNPDSNYFGLLAAAPENPFAATVDAARLSNLATTRSDHYTVYLLVQAWQGFGTAQARPVRQERVAFTIDRSGILPPGHAVPGLPGFDGYADADELIEALRIRVVNPGN